MPYDSPMRGWKYCFSSRNLLFPLLLPQFLLHLEGTSPNLLPWPALDIARHPACAAMWTIFQFQNTVNEREHFCCFCGLKTRLFFLKIPRCLRTRPGVGWWVGGTGRCGGGGGGWGAKGGRVLPCVRSKLQFHSKQPAHTVNKFLFKDSCFPQLNIIDFHN